MSSNNHQTEEPLTTTQTNKQTTQTHKQTQQVEHIIRQDYTIEAQEILELMCELLQERMRLIVAEETCPSDLVSAICTLIWACDRTDCPELQIVKAQFGKKYGDEFLKMAMANEGGCVNERVSYKLSVQVIVLCLLLLLLL